MLSIYLGRDQLQHFINLLKEEMHDTRLQGKHSFPPAVPGQADVIKYNLTDHGLKPVHTSTRTHTHTHTPTQNVCDQLRAYLISHSDLTKIKHTKLQTKRQFIKQLIRLHQQ